MRKDLIYLARISVCSVAALAISACARFTGADVATDVEPRRASAPVGVLKGELRGHLVVDELRIDELEDELQAVNFELRHLRKAIEVMNEAELRDGPYAAAAAAHLDTLNIAKLDEERVADGYAQIVDREDIFADPPMLNGAASLLHRANLAVYPTRGAAEADWARLNNEIDLADYSPRYNEANNGVRLSVGPFFDEKSVQEMCAELTAIAGVCALEIQEGRLH